MLLRRRPVLLLLLRTAACRTASTQGPASSAAPAGTPPPPPPPLSAPHPTRKETLGESTPQPGQEALHDQRRPLQAEEAARRTVYGKQDFNFVEVLRTSGPAAYLDRLRLSLSVYALAGSVTLLYFLYYLTTYTYVLTTDPAPYSKSFLSHFPCDMAVIENRLTHVRHTVEVTPNTPGAAAPGDTSGVVDDGAAHASGRLKPAIVERRLHVNAILHSIRLYLQKTKSTVIVDAQVELTPDRFTSGASTVGKLSRASLGFLRVDQRMRDGTDDSDSALAPAASRGWWPWRWGPRGVSREAGPSASPPASSSSTSTPTTPPAPAAARHIVLSSELRLRDAPNGYRKGQLSTYEESIAHFAREKLVGRYYAYVLARGMAENPGLRKVYAEELLRNGLLTGEAVTLAQLVPDVQQFADEVFAVVTEKFGDDVFLYAHVGATQ